MDELAAFLRARLDEDEAAAKGLMMATRFPGREPDFTGCGGPAAAAYWAHFPPHQRLREVAAGRAILALHHSEFIEVINADGDERSGYVCAECSFEDFPCPTLRHLAAVYDRHPDYRSEWAFPRS